jgi:hypothetical protein
MTQLLEYLQASADDQRKKDILRRYEGLLAFQRERFNMSILERKELVCSFLMNWASRVIHKSYFYIQ